MRFLVLSSLLYILLLCFSIFSAEDQPHDVPTRAKKGPLPTLRLPSGKRHPMHPATPRKGKPCCPPVCNPVLRTQKGHRVRSCKPCKFKPKSNNWVVPGALPQV